MEEEKRGVYLQAWLYEYMAEKEGEGHYSEKKPTTKNVVLIMINVLALILIVFGLGVVDQTDSIVAGYPLIIPSFIWLTVFVLVNHDRL